MKQYQIDRIKDLMDAKGKHNPKLTVKEGKTTMLPSINP